ncbi:hypothetical protein MKMG_02057 [Methanogenium sp. MK-MG]|nr:hypothetical protein MKMG_02057 [Methanogenium sp. MK-MG]
MYDYIFYIQSSAEKISAQCSGDTERKRTSFSVEKLSEWQDLECKNLNSTCISKNIPFSFIVSPNIDSRVMEFFKQLSQHNISNFCNEISSNSNGLYSVFDCDGTLFSGDCLDYLLISDCIDRDAVYDLFQKNEDYCFESFFEVAQYYSGIPYEVMQNFIERAAQAITLSPEILTILREQNRKRTLIWITSGFPEVWDVVGSRYKLNVIVIGGNNLARSPVIISNEEKATLVESLVNKGANVIAFGDSMADAEMLKNAQQAVIVIGKKRRDNLFEYLKTHSNLSIIDIRQTKITGVK